MKIFRVFILNSDGLESIELFGKRNVFNLAKLGLEGIHNVGWQNWANLRKALVLITRVLEKIFGIHSLITRQCHFDGNKTVQSRIVYSANLVRFGSLGPSKLGTRCVDNTDKQRKNSKADVGFVIVSFEDLVGTDTEKSSHTRQNNHGQVNLRAPNGLEFFRALMTPRQACRFFSKIRKENFEAFCPCNIVF